jgi:sporulation protein YlmC with PRC-barrel domain
MHLVKLSLAAPILLSSGIAAAPLEMTRPFEVLEQTRRAMIELDKRQEREGAERQKRENEQEAKRKRDESEQRKREREEKAQQEAQRKRDAVAAKAAQGARPPSPSLQPQPSATPALAHEPSVQSPTALPPTPPPAGQADEGRLRGRSEPAESRIGVSQGHDKPEAGVGSGNTAAVGVTAAPKNTTAVAPAAGGQAIAVSRLKRMNLYNERGDKLGDVEQVVQSPDGNVHIVIGAGGFLGIRERDVRIPLERVTIRGNRLVIQGLTDDQVRIMPVFDRRDRTYRDLTRNTTVRIVRDQSEN